jgi:hypothetical protein
MENIQYADPSRIVPLQMPPMSEAVAVQPARSCSLLLFQDGIYESQRLGTDPFMPRAHAREGWLAGETTPAPDERPCGTGNPSQPLSGLATRPLREVIE